MLHYGVGGGGGYLISGILHLEHVGKGLFQHAFYRILQIVGKYLLEKHVHFLLRV